MRQSRTAQMSIFENYAEHEFSKRLKVLSNILDETPEILTLLKVDLIDTSCQATGRRGLTVENILRCLVLKQQLQVSYEQLAFHLCDSMTYRTFARIDFGLAPKRSTLQSTIRRIRPKTLEALHEVLIKKWVEGDELSCQKIRIDSTVVESNIAPPSDSQLLNDGIRVLSRLMAKCRDLTGVKFRFTDKRKASKSLAFRIFYAKKAGKEALYPELISMTRLVIRQANRALAGVEEFGENAPATQGWSTKVQHFRDLTQQVIEQTQRRVINGEQVPSDEKLVSLFEPHTDVIVKGRRDIQYGHKINLSSECQGFITHISIEEENRSDKELVIPVLSAHQDKYEILPETIVADGGYASQKNVHEAKELGVRQVVFNKRVGLTYTAMGVKKKTFKKLANFRAGVEGNISELKRVYGVTRARWKGLEGFKAFVLSSVLSYNLIRMARLKLE